MYLGISSASSSSWWCCHPTPPPLFFFVLSFLLKSKIKVSGAHEAQTTCPHYWTPCRAWVCAAWSTAWSYSSWCHLYFRRRWSTIFIAIKDVWCDLHYGHIHVLIRPSLAHKTCLTHTSLGELIGNTRDIMVLRYCPSCCLLSCVVVKLFVLLLLVPWS
jgi:hypothetical protein